MIWRLRRWIYIQQLNRNSSSELSLGKPCGEFKTSAEIVKWMTGYCNSYTNVIVQHSVGTVLCIAPNQYRHAPSVIICTLSSLWIVQKIRCICAPGKLLLWKEKCCSGMCAYSFLYWLAKQVVRILCYSHRRWGNIIPESVESGNKVGGDWFEYQIALQSRFESRTKSKSLDFPLEVCWISRALHENTNRCLSSQPKWLMAVQVSIVLGTAWSHDLTIGLLLTG